MNAYRKSYLHNAANAFGCMTDYAVNACGLDGDIFLHMFIASGLAGQFEHGTPKVIVGMSGFDLASKAIAIVTGEEPSVLAAEPISYRTPEYWAGWALCHHQWQSVRSFAAILKYFPFAEIVANYYPLHEADITKFYTVAEERYTQMNPQINLKRIREAAGLSQAQLAIESGVLLRSIQMYEQRNKDVNKAQAITLAKIARTLGCNVEDLLERSFSRSV